jgi:hypothetical protein
MDAASSHRDRGTDLHDAMLFDQSTLPPPPRMILPFGERPSTGRLDATSHSDSHNNDTRPRTAPSNARGSILEEQRILLEDGLKRDSGFITSTRTKSGTAPRQHNDGDAAAPAHSPRPSSCTMLTAATVCKLWSDSYRLSSEGEATTLEESRRQRKPSLRGLRLDTRE